MGYPPIDDVVRERLKEALKNGEPAGTALRRLLKERKAELDWKNDVRVRMRKKIADKFDGKQR
jgi:signal transduction protein with GAF and PtsI domain